MKWIGDKGHEYQEIRAHANPGDWFGGSITSQANPEEANYQDQVAEIGEDANFRADPSNQRQFQKQDQDADKK